MAKLLSFAPEPMTAPISGSASGELLSAFVSRPFASSTVKAANTSFNGDITAFIIATAHLWEDVVEDFFVDFSIEESSVCEAFRLAYVQADRYRSVLISTIIIKAIVRSLLYLFPLPFTGTCTVVISSGPVKMKKPLMPTIPVVIDHTALGN